MPSIRSARQLRQIACAITVLTILILGCSRSHQPSLGLVSGTVSLDGVPLANAIVRFTPAGPGRTSEGISDADGHYRLLYLRAIPGANIDQHTVRITTASEENGGRELLPPRYHARSELEARVVDGTNRLDFDLRSQRP
jgi:hypothetical protein